MSHPSHRFGTQSESGLDRNEIDTLCRESGMADDARADELLASIEDCQSSARFVPDVSNETYRNAA